MQTALKIISLLLSYPSADLQAATQEVKTSIAGADGLTGTQKRLLERLAVMAGAGPNALARAQTQANKDRLKANVDEAFERGIFGAPSFIVEDELYWGDDRLEDALEAAAT